MFLDVKTFGNIGMKLMIIFNSQGRRGRGSKEDSSIVFKSKALILPSIFFIFLTLGHFPQIVIMVLTVLLSKVFFTCVGLNIITFMSG